MHRWSARCAFPSRCAMCIDYRACSLMSECAPFARRKDTKGRAREELRSAVLNSFSVLCGRTTNEC